jgi:polynucleotide 5'-hydroxyl-kinase GRC3/NOL9
MNQIEKEWQGLEPLFADSSGWGKVYVLGGNDSGKTTLCRGLANHFSRHCVTAFIDCDPGQSIVGPPATVGTRLFSADSNEISETWLRFVGSTAPRGHLLQTLSGILKLFEKSVERGAQKIVIDSSGFVFGNLAQEFQFHIIDLLRPDYLIVLRRKDEMDTLLANFTAHPNIKTVVVPVLPGAVTRTFEERRDYRKKKFRTYFRDAFPQELPFDSLGLHGINPDFTDPARLANLLLALCNPEHFAVALGIVKTIDLARKVISLHAPAFDPSTVTSLQLGSLFLDLDGQEIYKDDDITGRTR